MLEHGNQGFGDQDDSAEVVPDFDLYLAKEIGTEGGDRELHLTRAKIRNGQIEEQICLNDGELKQVGVENREDMCDFAKSGQADQVFEDKKDKKGSLSVGSSNKYRRAWDRIFSKEDRDAADSN